MACSRVPALIYIWSNDFRERVSCPVQPRFYRAQIALGDLGDLLIGLAFQLAQNEYVPVVFRELRNALLDDFPQVPFAVHVVRTRGGVLELQRTVLILEVLLHRLEEHERIPRSVAELVLGQVRRNGVDPGRELLRAVEAMQVPVDPDEYFLHQVLRLLAVTDRTVDEVQQTCLITRYQLGKGTLLATEESSHDG